jgi:mono/diheme cytochrome c family protein
MVAERERIQGGEVFRRLLLPLLGVVSVAIAAIAVGPARAQTNIDQGKPASELFANYCAVCHKSTRGLATGRNSLTLSLFLREHYAASSQQAAALAAYVISAGGNAPAKPERAKSEEPKGQEAKTQESKGQESKGRETKPRAALASPKSEPEKPPRGGQPGREEAAPVQPEPAPSLAAPAASAPPSSAEVPELRPTTSAGMSAESQSNDNGPVPRDNIPD